MISKEERRENYRMLVEAGYSPRFARNHDKGSRARILQLVQERKGGTGRAKLLKTNYNKLRVAGYSSKISSRYRNASEETIRYLISKRKRLTKLSYNEINNIIKQQRKQQYERKVKKLQRAGYALSKARVLGRTASEEKVKELIRRKRVLKREAARRKRRVEWRKKYDLLRRSGVPAIVAGRIAGRSWPKVYTYIRHRAKRRRINWVERRFMENVGAKSRKELYGHGKWAKRFAKLLYDLESPDNSPDGPKAKALIWLKVRRPDAEYGVGDTVKFERVIREA